MQESSSSQPAAEPPLTSTAPLRSSSSSSSSSSDGASQSLSTFRASFGIAAALACFFFGLFFLHAPPDLPSHEIHSTLSSLCPAPSSAAGSSCEWSSGGGASGGLALTFENLTIKFANGDVGLAGVTGSFLPGRLSAIMGGSGSGKSTLLMSLLHPPEATAGGKLKIEGDVRVNGRKGPIPRSLLAFVPQEDICHPDLTVFGALWSSAATRMPAGTPQSLILEAVSSTARTLQLDQHVAKRVGLVSDSSNGREHISGGQKKRTSIGMELVASAQALFLDEPTSGLDSVTSHALIDSLRTLAQNTNLTVAAVVHSPPQRTFKLFDDLVLLVAGGRAIYSGPRIAARSYFDSKGYKPVDFGAEDADDADYFMVIVQGLAFPSGGRKGSEREGQNLATQLWNDECTAAWSGVINFCTHTYQAVTRPHDPKQSDAGIPSRAAFLESRAPSMLPLNQIYPLFWRSFRLAGASSIATTVLLVALFGLIVGALASSDDPTELHSAKSTASAFAMAALFVSFAASLQLFDVEIASRMLDRERDAGLSQLILLGSKVFAGVGLAVITQALFLLACIATVAVSLLWKNRTLRYGWPPMFSSPSALITLSYAQLLGALCMQSVVFSSSLCFPDEASIFVCMLFLIASVAIYTAKNAESKDDQVDAQLSIVKHIVDVLMQTHALSVSMDEVRVKRTVFLNREQTLKEAVETGVAAKKFQTALNENVEVDEKSLSVLKKWKRQQDVVEQDYALQLLRRVRDGPKYPLAALESLAVLLHVLTVFVIIDWGLGQLMTFGAIFGVWHYGYLSDGTTKSQARRLSDSHNRPKIGTEQFMKDSFVLTTKHTIKVVAANSLLAGVWLVPLAIAGAADCGLSCAQENGYAELRRPALVIPSLLLQSAGCVFAVFEARRNEAEAQRLFPWSAVSLHDDPSPLESVSPLIFATLLALLPNEYISAWPDVGRYVAIAVGCSAALAFLSACINICARLFPTIASALRAPDMKGNSILVAAAVLALLLTAARLILLYVFVLENALTVDRSLSGTAADRSEFILLAGGLAGAPGQIRRIATLAVACVWVLESTVTIVRMLGVVWSVYSKKSSDTLQRGPSSSSLRRNLSAIETAPPSLVSHDDGIAGDPAQTAEAPTPASAPEAPADKEGLNLVGPHLADKGSLVPNPVPEKNAEAREAKESEGTEYGSSTERKGARSGQGCEE